MVFKSEVLNPTLATPPFGNITSGTNTSAAMVVGSGATLTTSGSGIIAASALSSATTVVNVSSATAPTAGQILTAISDTSATWQTPSGGGGGLSPYDSGHTYNQGDFIRGDGVNAVFHGQVAGMTTDITITANNLGTIGNAITFSFDGSTTIDSALSTWNIANPSNIAHLSGDETQIPDNGTTISLSGGSGNGFKESLYSCNTNGTTGAYDGTKWDLQTFIDNSNLNAAVLTGSTDRSTVGLNGVWNTVVGVGAGGFNSIAGNANTIIGSTSFITDSNVMDGASNTIIGAKNITDGNISTALYNVVVGDNCLTQLTTGSGNNVIGSHAAPYLVDGDNNIVVGHTAGSSLSSGSGNIIISAAADGDPSNTLQIANPGNANPIITITGTDTAFTGNQFLASPDGTTGAFSNRAIVDADLPVTSSIQTYVETATYNKGYYIRGNGVNAKFVGQVAGMTTDITLIANNAGVTGNNITLSFDGSTDITDTVNTWNTANPANPTLLTVDSDGTQIPDNSTTITLIGGTGNGLMTAQYVCITDGTTGAFDNSKWDLMSATDIVFENGNYVAGLSNESDGVSAILREGGGYGLVSIGCQAAGTLGNGRMRGYSSIYIGYYTGFTNTDSANPQNTIVGGEAASSFNFAGAATCTALGWSAVRNLVAGSNIIAIGANAGSNIENNSNVVILGGDQLDNTTSNILVISNSLGNVRLIEIDNTNVALVANKFLATPDGTTGACTLRSIVSADIPSNVALSGDPTTTTQSPLDNSTKIATTAYADLAVATAVTSVLIFQGAIDCSGNPNYPAATKGYVYVVSVAGKIGGVSGINVEINDTIYCIVTNGGGTQASVGTDFIIVQGNIDGVVIGPASATSNALAIFNSTTGKLIKNSGVTLSGGSLDIVNATTFVGALTGNASTASSAAILTTTRAIYGNNFDGSAALTQVIASTYGGTGNGFAKLSGPASTEKTFTLPNSSATILTDAAVVTAAQGGTGIANNAASTITISGNFGTTITVSGTTTVTFPTSGTLTTLATVVSTANTFTKAQAVTPVAVTSTSNSIATDASLSNSFTHTLTENTTLANPTNLVTGCYYQWTFTQAASAKTLAFGNKFKFPGGTAMVVSTGNAAVDTMNSYYDGTNLLTVFSQAFA